MNNLFRTKTLIFTSLVLILFACSQDPKNKSKSTENESTNIVTVDKENTTAYKIPSPVELYMFLQGNEMPFLKSAVNSVENIAKYYTNASKAINFGVYASDLAYCTVFGMHQETFLYFSTTRTLATDLGFTNGFDQIMVNRITSNLYNSDSLYQITNDSYSDACNYLEESGKRDVLALIFAGSWVESMHISIASVEGFSVEHPVVNRIADQRYLLDNLIEYFKSIDNNISTDKILDKLFDLQLTFDQLYDNPEETIITQSQFEEITEKINIIRNELIR